MVLISARKPDCLRVGSVGVAMAMPSKSSAVISKMHNSGIGDAAPISFIGAAPISTNKRLRAALSRGCTSNARAISRNLGGFEDNVIKSSIAFLDGIDMRGFTKIKITFLEDCFQLISRAAEHFLKTLNFLLR
jgi:hypothetical protein